MYLERPSRIPGAVRWSRTAGAPGQARVLPDGCMDLMMVGDVLKVAGPDLSAQVTPLASDEEYLALRLPPGTAPGALGVPASALRDARVPLADLWPASRVRRLRDRLLAGDPYEVLESLVPPTTPWIVHTRRVMAGGGSVGALADDLGWSPRQLLRESDRVFGYGPRVLARILRFRRAVRLGTADGAPALADLARSAGYSDQAHLSREVKQFAGVTPSTLFA
ncbi:helix-turn-helix domain-containing protein [Nakamurella sp. YIM 132087]|uniref:Helix-turn-helix domain-containing protein n=1 Tax=Nakamurella alba TaxID=2665158 RepID=A0A7K1FNK8_9ACTN|nr:helix-turn-helix domain-containing protein [Nakamurella alba]MTD15726.1 helix-turn-helix domain-containing protein [Nakamurella alba]